MKFCPSFWFFPLLKKIEGKKICQILGKGAQPLADFHLKKNMKLCNSLGSGCPENGKGKANYIFRKFLALHEGINNLGSLKLPLSKLKFYTFCITNKQKNSSLSF